MIDKYKNEDYSDYSEIHYVYCIVFFSPFIFLIKLKKLL